MGIFFRNFVKVNEQHFDLSIPEVKELQKTFGGILQHSFPLVRLIKSNILFCDCF